MSEEQEKYIVDRKSDKNNKEKQVMIRLESELKELIDDYTNANNCTTSEFIREAIIEKIVKYVDVNKTIAEKQVLEAKHIEKIKFLQEKLNDLSDISGVSYNKTETYAEIDLLSKSINKYNSLIKWYYEYVLQK